LVLGEFSFLSSLYILVISPLSDVILSINNNSVIYTCLKERSQDI
jgi:hypothetical protein